MVVSYFHRLFLYLALSLLFVKLTYSLSIFLLGDSTSERLFVHGLIPTFNCTSIDPSIKKFVEAVSYKDYARNRGMTCNSTQLSRIGYMIHWGVAKQDGDYSHNWTNHRSSGDTENSIANIINSIKEFQQRSGADSDTIFIFLSNLWDQHRHYTFHPDVAQDIWLQEFHRNYTSAVILILESLRPQDKLVIQTQHKVKESEDFAATVPVLNNIIKKVAQFFNLPLFDMEKLAGNNTVMYLADGVHQDRKMSITMAQLLVNRNWTVASKECSTE
jgi:hypothetical protein